MPCLHGQRARLVVCILCAGLLGATTASTNSLWGSMNWDEGYWAGVDADGDGYDDDRHAFPNDSQEWVDTDSYNIGNKADLDDDGDSIPDAFELTYSLDPLDRNDADLDADDACHQP